MKKPIIIPTRDYGSYISQVLTDFFLSGSRFSTIKGLVYFLSCNLLRHQELRICQWMNDKWYVEVLDLKIAEKVKAQTGDVPMAMLVGFSVNISMDSIVWNYDGGSCWCRNRRWWKLIQARFPYVAQNNAPRPTLDPHDRTSHGNFISLYRPLKRPACLK